MFNTIINAMVEDPSLIPEMTSDTEIQLEKVAPPQQAPQ